MSNWADDLIERLQKANRDFSDRLEVAERTKTLAVSVKNDQHGIEITVGDDCRIERLALSPSAMKIPPRELSAEILRLASSARAKYARELERVNLETLGDNDLSRRIVEEIRQNYPEEAEEESPRQEDPHAERQRDAWDQGRTYQAQDEDEDDEGWSWRR